MENTIKIGGVECAYKVTYGDFGLIMYDYNQYYTTAINIFYNLNGFKFDVDNEDHHIAIPHIFFFNALWTCLDKTGRWLSRRPYRSLRAMIKKINMEEHEEIVVFLGVVIASKKDSQESKKPNDDKRLSLVEYFKYIEDAYFFQRHRLRAFCGYTETEIDCIDIERGQTELEWYYDKEMQGKIDMFSANGVDVQDVKRMGTSFYRDYILSKKSVKQKADTPEDEEKYKGGFDDILKTKRGAENGK